MTAVLSKHVILEAQHIIKEMLVVAGFRNITHAPAGVGFKSQVPNDQMQVTPVPRITVLAEQQDLDPTPAGACVIPESSNSKHFFNDVQGFKSNMLTKDRSHERTDDLVFITRAANADRLPNLYDRS